LSVFLKRVLNNGWAVVLIPLVLIVPALVFLAGLLVFFLPRYFYHIVLARRPAADFYRTVGLPRPSVEREPDWLSTQTLEDLWIKAEDGLMLHAYYLAAPAAGGAGGRTFSGTAVLAHGYSGDGRQMGAFARIFHEKFGMPVLLPEARGHGLSQGAYIGFGWHERLDMLAWFKLLQGRGEDQIVLYGISMGASTALMTSGEKVPPELRLIIADCGYTSVAEELTWQLKRLYHISCPPLVRAVSRLAKKRAGYCFEEASALEQVKKSQTPTLFIHGEADTFVPFEMCGRLYAACTAEKELYTVPGAEHGLACHTDSGEYERRLALFLEKYLPGIS
jgi:fermentation-respiration switch protein FrsA (DUF1100 family)